MLHTNEAIVGGRTSDNPLRNDQVYVAAWELSDKEFPWHKSPVQFEDPMKRIVARNVEDLMRRVHTLTETKVSASRSLIKAETELDAARAELAAAVASWPKG